MFVVRVELHDVPERKAREVYDNFHTSMEKAGFKKQVLASNKKWYRLPDATYVAHGDFEVATVRAIAAEVANGTSYRSSLIVFRCDGTWASIGLEEVDTSESNRLNI